MKDKESSQSAELNSDHGDIDPSFGAGLGGFIIAHESALLHQPAEGAFHDPTAGQDFEAREVVRTFDHRDHQLAAKAFDPVGKRLAGVATIHPQDAQPGEPTQNLAQQDLCARAFSRVGRGHGYAEQQSQSIHQQMPLAAFDPLAGVVAHQSAMPGGLDTLTIQNRRRGAAALAVRFPHERAQRVVECRPLMVSDPLPEDMINRFPMGKVDGQITPRATTLDQIQDGINDPPPINWWAATFGSFRQHRFEVSPLGIRETGVIYGVFTPQRKLRLKLAAKLQVGCQPILQQIFRAPANSPVNRTPIRIIRLFRLTLRGFFRWP
jgi:hypothetical protein